MIIKYFNWRYKNFGSKLIPSYGSKFKAWKIILCIWENNTLKLDKYTLNLDYFYFFVCILFDIYDVFAIQQLTQP